MEYHKHRYTPLDRIDETLLAEVLGQGERCQGGTKPQHATSRCGCERGHHEEKMGGAIFGVADTCGRTCPKCGKAEHKCTCGGSRRVLEREEGCGDFAGYKVPSLSGNPLSMVYCPYQEWGNLYECDHGFTRGTIFKCLDFPFYHASCSGNSSCGCRNR